MKASVVYRYAAAILGHGSNLEYSCNAIKSVARADGFDRFDSVAFSDEYAELFSPRIDMNLSGAWGKQWSNGRHVRKECRVLALLFMAAIAESEGR